MKTKINIAILIVVASISLAACVEEEIKPGPLTGSTQTTTAPRNTHTLIQ
jgi:hypothetical protein